MHFTPSRSDVVHAVRQRFLLKYWHWLCGTQALPKWSGIEAEEIKSTLDSVNFYDVVRNGAAPRFKIRYQGARITQAYGADCTGKFFDEVLPPTVRDDALATYHHAVQQRRPVYTVSKTYDRQGRMVSYERLLLPFTIGGDQVERILTSLEMVSLYGKFEQDNMMPSQTEAPVYSVCATITAGGDRFGQPPMKSALPDPAPRFGRTKNNSNLLS